MKNGSNACNYLLSCDLGFNPLPNTQMASYEKGFGDFTMKADIDSMREVNYISDNKQLFFFADLYDQDLRNPVTHAPRYLLRKAIEDLKQLGIKAHFQCDINFYVFFDKYKKICENFHTQPSTEHHNLYNTLYKQNLDEFLNKLKSSLKVSGIHVDSISGDEAPGQFKLSLTHTDPIEFCDNITLLKLIVKKIAEDNDKTISFMPKLNEHWKGNALNVKLILKDNENNNILENVRIQQDKLLLFPDLKGENSVSGIVNHIPDFFIFYAPTVNSYKRLKEFNLASNWNKVGYMQDDMGVNLIRENGVDKILFKIPSCDVNTYLNLYALLTSVFNYFYY